MNEIILIEDIKNKIYTIRGVQVMLDRDLAQFYNIETRVLKQAIKRNKIRFPKDFMFELSKNEVTFLVSQNVIPSIRHLGGSIPYAFTEQGVAMLSSVLNSEKAIQVSISIIRAFIHMKNYLKSNEILFQKIETLEKKHFEYDNNFNKIFNLLEHKELEKGIFFEGQLFDSHIFISDLIRKAKNKIILIDNYVDENTLLLFNKKEKGVKVIIYTKNINKNLKQDLEKYNSQYETIEIKEFNLSHDRFLIIDEEVYHIGASLKDIGKKWFGFSKMDKDSLEIMTKLEKNHKN